MDYFFRYCLVFDTIHSVQRGYKFLREALNQKANVINQIQKQIT